MIRHCVAWCSRHSMLIIVMAVVLGLGGELARRRLSRDAVPDLSDPQIGLVVEWMGHPASEVATRVTQVLTESLKSVPAAKAVRGESMSGMAYVDIWPTVHNVETLPSKPIALIVSKEGFQTYSNSISNPYQYAYNILLQAKPK